MALFKKTRLCGRCLQRKYVEDFQRNPDDSMGVKSVCRQCTSERDKAYYQTKKAARIEQVFEWRSKNYFKRLLHAQRYNAKKQGHVPPPLPSKDEEII